MIPSLLHGLVSGFVQSLARSSATTESLEPRSRRGGLEVLWGADDRKNEFAHSFRHPHPQFPVFTGLLLGAPLSRVA